MRGDRVRVRRLPDGRWGARPYLGTDAVTGRRIRPQRTWPADWSEERAQAACDEWMAGWAPAAASRSGKRLGSMLSKYVEDPSHGWSCGTVAAYRSCIENHIEPTIGDVPYDELEPYMVGTAYRILLTGTRRRGPITRTTLRKTHALLCGAYREWQRQLRRNPMLDVPAPSPERMEPISLGEWDQEALTEALLSIMGDDRADCENRRRRTVAFAAYLALNEGLRCGEACAVQRRDWRRSVHELHVGATMVEKPSLERRLAPKRFSIGNVAVAPAVEAEIARNIEWQDAWMRAPGPGTPLACPDPFGRPQRPSAVSRAFTALARELGMPEGTTMHTLRHTHATWLIMNGFDMRTVQERLRHADVRTTLALYTTVAPGRDAQAAAAFAAAGNERRG